MKKHVFYLYTLLHTIWVPLLFALPAYTLQATGKESWTVSFPFLPLVPLYLLLEYVLTHKYRRESSLLSSKYWLVTGGVGLAITAVLLLLILPGMPFHANGTVQSVGFVFFLIAMAAVATLLSTIPQILARKKPSVFTRKTNFLSKPGTLEVIGYPAERGSGVSGELPKPCHISS